MIRYESGNLLESQSVALVNAVNCQGVMGKGIAYQFKQKFPINYTAYKNACERGDFLIGSILIIKEEKKLVVNFPTKNNWRKKSEYKFIEQGLIQLKKEIIDRDINSISIPPLGCGNGGLDWGIVESMIIDILGELTNVDIVLYAPPVKEDLANKKSIINIKHLLVHYVFKNIFDKKRYTLNTTFYVANFLDVCKSFDFVMKHNRPYSPELDMVANDIKVLKAKYGDDFENFIEGYINTHLTKDMESEFKKYMPSVNFTIGVVNKMNSKEELVKLSEIIKNISDGKTLAYESGTIENIILEQLLQDGMIQKNILNEYDILKR